MNGRRTRTNADGQDRRSVAHIPCWRLAQRVTKTDRRNGQDRHRRTRTDGTRISRPENCNLRRSDNVIAVTNHCYACMNGCPRHKILSGDVQIEIFASVYFGHTFLFFLRANGMDRTDVDGRRRNGRDGHERTWTNRTFETDVNRALDHEKSFYDSFKAWTTKLTWMRF